MNGDMQRLCCCKIGMGGIPPKHKTHVNIYTNQQCKMSSFKVRNKLLNRSGISKEWQQTFGHNQQPMKKKKDVLFQVQ
jgi:hypothetical protein